MFSQGRLMLVVLFWVVVFSGVVSISLVFTWLMLELSTMLFLYLIFNLKLNYVNNLIHYYLIQVSASVGLFFSILVFLISSINLDSVFLYLKLGVFPFHYWYFGLLLSLDWKELFLLMSPSKAISLSMLFGVVRLDQGLIFLLNLGFVLVSIFSEKKIKLLLGMSSLFNMAWVLSSVGLGYFWIIYFLGYSVNLFFMVWLMVSIGGEMVGDSRERVELESLLILCLLVFFMLGVPPFLLFFLKVYLLMELLVLGGAMWGLLIISGGFVYVYLMFFFYLLSTGLEKWKSLGQFHLGGKFLFASVINFGLSMVFLLCYYLNNNMGMVKK